MMSRLVKRAVFILALCLLAPPVHAQIHTYSVTMSGPNESPPNGSPGIGSGFIIYDQGNHTLDISVTFSGLIGNTTVAHIHAATSSPFTGTAGVATYPGTFPGFPAGVTSGSYTSGLINLTLSSSFTAGYLAANGGTPAGAEAGLFNHMNNGQAYFNIHSTSFPGGEIRGFLVSVPEPSTVVLIGAGLLGLGIYQLKRMRRTPRFCKA